MKALLSREPGGPETLELGELPLPEPQAGEIRLRVKACAINYPDVLVIQDLYQYKPDRPFAPGAEIAGFVDAIGAGVEGFASGDRVVAVIGWGGLAEQVCVAKDRCFRIPDEMPFDEAAALLIAYGTANYALTLRGGLRAGETLLVLGAAGGVGLAAVEIGKALGAKVIGAVSSPEKAAIVRQYGADATLIYPSGELGRDESKALTAQIREAAGGEVDVIYDAVGGSYAEPALRAIGWAGRYLVVGFAAGIPSLPLNLVLLKSCQVIGVFYGASFDRFVAQFHAGIAEIFDHYQAGHLHPLISRRYPFERGGDAITHLASRGALGKVVVMMDD